MHLIRCATLTVSDLSRSTALYGQFLDYEIVETGQIDSDLAASWDAPLTAGCPYAVMRPSSGLPVYLRFIEQPAVSEYRPLRSFGWAAIEICVQDTLAVCERMKDSPFEIIGPPKELDGMPAIFPMQVKGPDGEIVYLTEIREDMAEYDLPRAQSLIDRLFILVMACRDLEVTGQWLETHVSITKGRSMEIIYSMINNAFALPNDTKHALATLKHERDVFLEIDTYPNDAVGRPQHDGMLAPCAAIGSFIHPDFDKLTDTNKGNWITPPAIYSGIIYDGRRSAALKTPDGTLLEIIEI